MDHQDKELLRYRDLETKGYGSRTTIWRAVKAGNFPTPHDDGRGNPVWFREEIEDWKASLQRFQPKETHQRLNTATA